MRLAVITPARGRHDHLRLQQRSLDRSALAPAVRVVVGMGDPGLADVLPGSVRLVDAGPGTSGLPLARARNLGARVATDAGADLLVFLDLDCLVGPQTLERYAAAAAGQAGAGGSLLTGAVGYLPPPPPAGYDLDALPEARYHPARPRGAAGELAEGVDPRLFWSLSFALRPGGWVRVGGFDEAYEGYGAEDTDFGQRAAQAGVGLTFVGGAETWHQWHPVSAPPVEHTDDLLRNGQLFADRWGWWPMQGWFEQLAEQGLVRPRPGGLGWDPAPTETPTGVGVGVRRAG